MSKALLSALAAQGVVERRTVHVSAPLITPAKSPAVAMAEEEDDEDDAAAEARGAEDQEESNDRVDESGMSITLSPPTARRASSGGGGKHRAQGSGLTSLSMRTASTPAKSRDAADFARSNRAEHAAAAAAAREREAQQDQIVLVSPLSPIADSPHRPSAMQSPSSAADGEGGPSDSPREWRPDELAFLSPQRRKKNKKKPALPRSRSKWAASHNHLLQNLSTLRDEIVRWEDEAYARIKAAEDELAASKASEAAVSAARAQAAREAAESRLYFFNSFAAARVDNIKQGGDGLTPLLPESAATAEGGRRATWSATEAAQRAAIALGLAPQAAAAQSPVGSDASASPSAAAAGAELTVPKHQRLRSTEQDLRALQDLQKLMNSDRDEEWMQAILELGSPRKQAAAVSPPAAAAAAAAAPAAAADPASSPSKPASSPSSSSSVLHVASPSRPSAQTNRPVSKVYSALALEHRRALRRHPKIVKWMQKFWRVWFPRAANDGSGSSSGGGGKSGGAEEESKANGEPKKDATLSAVLAVAAATSAVTASASSAAPTARSESDGITKSEFLTFYHLVHKVFSGDSVDLSSSAAHDWDRRCSTRSRMVREEFCDILFELVDLWCLTHVPEDYVSIFKALYCRCTERSWNQLMQAPVTSWVLAKDVGVDPTGSGSLFKVAPILGAPNATADAKRAARRAKQRQYEKIMAQQAREDRRAARIAAARAAGQSEAAIEESLRRLGVDESSSDEDEDDKQGLSSSDGGSSDESDLATDDSEPGEGDEQAEAKSKQASVPLVDENGRLLSLNSSQVRHAGNRLRARETQYVNEAVLALNENVSSFHDQSNLVLKAARAGSSVAELTSDSSAGGFSSIYSGSGMGYAARRKTIGLKWSIVSELMETEIEKAKRERDEIEKRNRKIKREAAIESRAAAAAAQSAAAAQAAQSSDPASSSAIPMGKLDLGAKPGNARAAPTTLQVDPLVLGIARSPRSDRSRSMSLSVTGADGLLPRSPNSARVLSFGNGEITPRHLYAALDEGDSDLEDEEEARLVRLARKERVGHSWPSLQRVLAWSRKVKSIESSWIDVVSASLARKRKAEALAAQARLLKHFKRTRNAAEKQARIAGMHLKPNLDLSDLPMLEAVAALNFVRGGEKAAEKIAALVEEREREREAERQEKARKEKEIAAKREAHAAALRRARAAKERGEKPSAAAASDVSPERPRGAAPAVNPRRASWKPTGHAAAVTAAPADGEVSHRKHPDHVSAEEAAAHVRLSRAAAAAAVAAGARKHPSDRDPSTRVALVALPGGRSSVHICHNPRHDHLRPRVGRMGVTEIGSRYPIDDPNDFGPGECIFSPPPLAGTAGAGVGNLSQLSSQQQQQQNAEQAAAMVADLNSGPHLHAQTRGPGAGAVAQPVQPLQSQLVAQLAQAQLYDPSGASSIAAAPFAVRGGHMHIAPKTLVSRSAGSAGARRTGSGTGQLPASVTSQLASQAADARSFDDGYVPARGMAGSAIGASAAARGNGVVAASAAAAVRPRIIESAGPSRRHGTASARSSSPAPGTDPASAPVAPVAALPPAYGAQSRSGAVRPVHTRQRSRSAVASPLRHATNAPRGMAALLADMEWQQSQQRAQSGPGGAGSVAPHPPSSDVSSIGGSGVHFPAVGAGNGRPASNSRPSSPGRGRDHATRAVHLLNSNSAAPSGQVYSTALKAQPSFGLVPQKPSAAVSGGGSAAAFAASHSHAHGSPQFESSHAPYHFSAHGSSMMFAGRNGGGVGSGGAGSSHSVGFSPVMRAAPAHGHGHGPLIIPPLNAHSSAAANAPPGPMASRSIMQPAQSRSRSGSGTASNPAGSASKQSKPAESDLSFYDPFSNQQQQR